MSSNILRLIKTIGKVLSIYILYKISLLFFKLFFPNFTGKIYNLCYSQLNFHTDTCTFFVKIYIFLVTCLLIYLIFRGPQLIQKMKNIKMRLIIYILLHALITLIMIGVGVVIFVMTGTILYGDNWPSGALALGILFYGSFVVPIAWFIYRIYKFVTSK